MLKISKAYAGLSVGTICPAPITVAKVNPSNCQTIPDMVWFAVTQGLQLFFIAAPNWFLYSWNQYFVP